MGKYVSTGTELYHYGVLGMKWGVCKSEYKSMNKQQRQETRNKYYNTPEGKIKRATSIGTMLAGQVGGVIAGSIMVKKVDKLQKNIVNNGKKNFEKHKTAKIETSNKTKKLLENTKTNRDETDEQKITRLMNEGKINPKAHHIFDQNGNLFMVYYDD